MPNTTAIKLLMLGLFVAAGLVVTRVGILINKTFHPAVARISSALPVDYGDSDDFDHDGLDNGEEAVWKTDPYNSDTDGDGYFDGEEVASGHSPLELADDSLNKTREFLAMSSTDRLTQLIAGGIISGELKNSSNDYAGAIDGTARATVYSILSALENVEIGDEVVATADNSQESQEAYLKVLFLAISKDLTKLVYDQPKELILLFSPDQFAPGGEIFSSEQKERIKSKFLQHSVTFQIASEKLSQALVPSGWVEIQRETLTLLKKLELYHRSIALSIDDPLKQMVVLGNLQNVYFEAKPILAEIDKKIKGGHLNPPSNDFFNISSLLTK